MSALGTKLRDARIEKGYTLNTLQQMTKIQKKYLVAIEEGNLSELPGSFYIRAFVKQYADVVGLNGDDILQEYAGELEVFPEANEAPVINNIESEELGSRVKARQDSFEKNNLEIILSYLPLLFLIAIILMIIITLIMAISRMNNSNKPIEQVPTTSIVSTVAPESAVPETTSEETTSQTDELADNQLRVGNKVLTKISGEGEETVYEVEGSDFDGYTFGVKGSGYVWVGMLEDDRMVVDTTVTDGEKFEYTVQKGVKTFRMRLGYPDGGKFTVNGQELDLNNPYFSDTVVFVVKDSANEANASEAEEASEQPAEETTEAAANAESADGPAVLRGQNSGSGNE
ncbi:helix-turn-helix domain-containing protein [Tuanshanicoccus lijuaniae]|uniref:helix-turn-helix domain-containing protein n=1 Tax=Aerococcaceae bacterium zg-1292 TaxID=2774330 RepID=UPI001BD8044D|nr:helix-turn-helix domain-containing protein [Aerococcaceae bacterium zg-BR22]MBS4455548.1 helix-turn-helix domain-containing protein [Aerococcaceae bacterium zg-A91]MBS4457167.1 helix-turn-helix domain-containing protein [Aerococcaceae bacterium zg-BR33]